jgi:hypothetical protein
MKVPNEYTTDPLAVAAHVGLEPEFIRLPRDGERDPVFGLSRGFLNTLVLACKANGYQPAVKSCVLRRRGARTGVRLINLKSLREYVYSQAAGTDPAISHGKKEPPGDLNGPPGGIDSGI